MNDFILIYSVTTTRTSTTFPRSQSTTTWRWAWVTTAPSTTKTQIFSIFTSSTGGKFQTTSRQKPPKGNSTQLTSTFASKVWNSIKSSQNKKYTTMVGFELVAVTLTTMAPTTTTTTTTTSTTSTLSSTVTTTTQVELVTTNLPSKKDSFEIYNVMAKF